MINNWRTTSAGITMIGGAIIHLVFAIHADTANENTWTITLGLVVGGIGLIFAGDGAASADKKEVKEIAAKVEDNSRVIDLIAKP